MRDRRGIPIGVGDKIAYAVKRSTTVDLMIAEVLTVAEDHITAEVDGSAPNPFWRKYARPVKLRNGHTIVIIQQSW